MMWPDGTLTRPPVTSAFGMRRHPLTGVWKLHAGCDLIRFSLVHAIASGTVVAVGTPNGWTAGGVQVWVQHDGFLTRYMHLKVGSPAVRVGDAITAGRILGVMGMTGGADGVHLHLEVVVNGSQIDPVPFITARLSAVGGKTSVPTIRREDSEMRFIKAAVKGITRFALITLGKGQETTDVAQANLWAQTFGDARVVTEDAYLEALNNVAKL